MATYSLRERFVAAVKAFREPYLASDTLDQSDFVDFGARKLRYDIFWSFYENTAYRNLHTWSRAYKTEYGLYRYIRNIYNPAYRLIEFHVTHVWGGALDLDAGDGKAEPSALPITTDNEALREAIGCLWRDSNWQVRKDAIVRYGAAFGDWALRIVDDTEKKKVYLEHVHPGTIKDVTMDAYRNVKGYVIEEQRDHPNGSGQTVTYTEKAWRDGVNVVYQTLMNGTPYAWNGVAAEWSEPYGFVPFVLGQHNDVGLEWGWSELHPARPKIHEVDDLASKLHDQIRKIIDPVWLLAGVTKPADELKTSTKSPTTNRPEPGREELPAIYGPAETSAQPLVAPIDIAATAAEINATLQDIERDFPELKDDIHTASGDASGRALRTARQQTESKVRQRRANYDSHLVRAHQMAIAIGGYRRYPGYEGFNLESYERGALDHRIAKRPVFAQDPLDDIEVQAAFWLAAKTAVESGVPLEVYLKERGWDEDLIAQVVEARSRQMSEQAEMEAVKNQGSASAALGVMGMALRTNRRPQSPQIPPTPPEGSDDEQQS